MKRTSCIALGLLVAWLALAPRNVAAQEDPDLREILPYLMLVIDTSGSMERLPACTCTSPGCEECLPDCTLPNGSGGVPPVSMTTPPRELKKNRWAVTLEALTGTIQDFECERLPRIDTNGATYDLGYYLPYNQPWDCPSQMPFTACAPTATNFRQDENGILDHYASSFRFGLMTFDGWDTYQGATPLVASTNFDNARSTAVQGLWSYGGPKEFHYPGCDTDYMMDTGARNPNAAQGSLISLNSCSGGGSPGNSATCPSWCYACDGSQGNINRDIQEALISARPYGGTPIAASLEDLYHHFRYDTSDMFGGCRNRYALLLTDGYPDADYRDVGCNCANEGDPMDPYRCGPDPSNIRFDPAAMKCPYAKAEDIANDLVHGRGGGPAMIRRLFVVGLAVEDQSVLQALNLIARRGCTRPPAECDADGDGNEALFADSLSELVQNLSRVLDGESRPVSRSVPAFAEGKDTSIKQYQISTGFKVGTAVGQPWSGVVERRRFTCNVTTHQLDSVQLESPTGSSTNGDQFQKVLTDRTGGGASRVLWTATLPSLSGWDNGAAFDKNGHLYGGISGSPCAGTSGCREVAFQGNSATPATGSSSIVSGTFTAEAFGLSAGTAGDARGEEILAWLRGASGTPRANFPLGDIYHSSPVVMGSPRFDTADEAFNEFRRSSLVQDRPLTMFVGSNDGILHAFSVERNTALGLVPGQEIWGFVPPMLLDRLEDNLNSHGFSMDGTPVVKNVYFNRTPGESGSADQYRSVLITGMRSGGNAYIALDVTDPINPKFLWQFTDAQMGKTFGQPAIAQAVYTVNQSGTNVVKEGAVAILPGGAGQTGAISGECSNGATNQTMRNSSGEFETLRDVTGTATLVHRSDVRCWQDMGRALYFVEVETGRLLKKLYLLPDSTRMFASPIISTPAIYQADVGTLTTQAYVVDADGVIWRVDMSAPDQVASDPMTGWTARPFHDIFFDRGPSDGELTYEAPMLSVDNEGRVVVMVGTGDNNNFVKPTIRNRVVSLTEVLNIGPFAPPGPERFRAAMNWEMRVKATATGTRLVESELVTGTMGLFNGTLFFGTFIALGGSDPCDLGRGRVHAVHYRLRDTTQPNDSSGTYAPMLVDAATNPTGSAVINVAPQNAVNNLMLMGLGLTQRPNCTVTDPEDNLDVWGQSYSGISSVSDPAIYLVAQGSGATNITGLLQQRAGSGLDSIELRIDKPSSVSRVISWATTID